MNEQREIVVQRLSEQFAADRLSLEEFERRVDLVYKSQNATELAEITADLTAMVPSFNARPVGERGPVLQRVRTALGNLERSGPMEIPARLEVRVIMGNVELDLREAVFGAFTEIAVKATMGNVEITLPFGVRVESDGDGFLGSYACHIVPGTMPMVGTAPVVRLTGRALLANVEVYAAAPDPGHASHQHRAIQPP